MSNASLLYLQHHKETVTRYKESVATLQQRVGTLTQTLAHVRNAYEGKIEQLHRNMELKDQLIEAQNKKIHEQEQQLVMWGVSKQGIPMATTPEYPLNEQEQGGSPPPQFQQQFWFDYVHVAPETSNGNLNSMNTNNMNTMNTVNKERRGSPTVTTVAALASPLLGPFTALMSSVKSSPDSLHSSKNDELQSTFISVDECETERERYQPPSTRVTGVSVGVGAVVGSSAKSDSMSLTLSPSLSPSASEASLATTESLTSPSPFKRVHPAPQQAFDIGMDLDADDLDNNMQMEFESEFDEERQGQQGRGQGHGQVPQVMSHIAVSGKVVDVKVLDLDSASSPFDAALQNKKHEKQHQQERQQHQAAIATKFRPVSSRLSQVSRNSSTLSEISLDSHSQSQKESATEHDNEHENELKNEHAHENKENVSPSTLSSPSSVSTKPLSRNEGLSNLTMTQMHSYSSFCPLPTMQQQHKKKREKELDRANRMKLTNYFMHMAWE